MDFDMLTNVRGYCFPAFIYAMLVAYTIIFTLVSDLKFQDGTMVTLKDKIMMALLEIIFGVIILYSLLLLCKNNMEMYAWIVLLLPLILNFANYLFIEKSR